MADEADRSDKRIEDTIANGIEMARLAANKPKAYFESCAWCGDPTEGGAKFCCGDCAKDHAWYEDAQKRNGS